MRTACVSRRGTAHTQTVTNVNAAGRESVRHLPSAQPKGRRILNRHGSFLSKPALFSIHILTAVGAALALFSVFAALEGEWASAFAWIGAALIVDGIDGPLARQFRLREALPEWDGAALDFVIDYTTYVFVPAVMLAGAFDLGRVLGQGLAALVCIVGALYFADARMKQPNNAFRGFPSAWNMLIFVLFATSLPGWAVTLAILVFCVLTFVPVNFVHPVRVLRWRPFTLAAFILWSVAAAWLIATNFATAPVVTGMLVVVSIYLSTVGAVQQYLFPREA